MPRRAKTLSQLAGTGDDGSTGLLGGGRAPKDDPRVEAYGSVDEASSAIGLARALATTAPAAALLEECQRVLYRLGAELASTRPGEFAVVTEADLERLEAQMGEIESGVQMPSHFILPGQSVASAAVDVARTVVRRAERRLITLERISGQTHDLPRRYLNRLSLCLFVIGRLEEDSAGVEAKAARNPE